MDGPSYAAAAPVRFELRGLRNVPDAREYSTGYMHQATVVALGDSVTANRPYLVFVEVRRVSGGDPSLESQPKVSIVAVRHGVGDFAAYGGFRSKGDDWKPEVIDAQVIGYLPIVPTASPAVSER